MAECVIPDNSSVFLYLEADNLNTMELSHMFQTLPTSYASLFDLCHFILAAMSLRKEVGIPFSRSNPLATWLATMTASFAGGLLANPLLGQPILSAVSNRQSVLLATAAWWVVFYWPGDGGHTLAKNKAIFIPICIIKEIYRAKKILGGITTAAQMFPEQELVLVVMGLVKGAGSNLMRPVTRLVCGVWSPGSTEVLAMSTTCKATLVAATLMVVERNGYLLCVSSDQLYVLIVFSFIFNRLASFVAEPVDPFKYLEQITAYFAFGGLWDGSRGGQKTNKVD